MKKTKLMSVMVALAMTIPLATLSSGANAHSYTHHRHYHHYYHHHCYGNYYYRHCGAHITGKALVNRVTRNLRANITTADLPICVTAVGHRVILSGFTGTAAQKQAAIAITRYTCGVSLVVDNIHLQQP